MRESSCCFAMLCASVDSGVAIVWLMESAVRSVFVTKAADSREVTFNGMLVVVSSVLTYTSMFLGASVISLGTIGIFLAVLLVVTVLLALAVLLFAAIALLVAVGFSATVGIVVVVFSLLAILIGVTVATLKRKAVFAAGLMTEMTIA